MKFDLIRYYDTCCCMCGNWATETIGAAALCKSKEYSNKVLYNYGWRVIKGKTFCPNCIAKNFRIWSGDKWMIFDWKLGKLVYED